jgi:hypothetical protein
MLTSESSVAELDAEKPPPSLRLASVGKIER